MRKGEEEWRGYATRAISRSRERAHLARSRCLSPANTKPPSDRPRKRRASFRKDRLRGLEEGRRGKRGRQARLPVEKCIAAEVMDRSKSYASRSSDSFSRAARELDSSRERRPGNSCPTSPPPLAPLDSPIPKSADNIDPPRKRIASRSSGI